MDKPKFKMTILGENLAKSIGFPFDHPNIAIKLPLLTLEHALAISWMMQLKGSLQQQEGELLSFGQS